MQRCFFPSSIHQILWILLESIIGPQYECIKWFSSVVYSMGTKRVLFTGNKRDSTKAGLGGLSSLREELKNSLRCPVSYHSFASILWCANNVITNTQVNQLSSFPHVTLVSVSFKPRSFTIIKNMFHPCFYKSHSSQIPKHSSGGASTSPCKLRAAV